jgi:predicted glycosyltransferase
MRSVLFCNEMLGLGHLRLSLELARALVEPDERSTALVVTGSGAFAGIRCSERVDLLKLPAPPVGDSPWSLTSLRARAGLALGEQQATALRAALSLAAVQQFDPEVAVVDYRPLGRGEDLRPALEWLRRRGSCTVALGLWEVDDVGERLSVVWTPRLLEAVGKLYDLALVYGEPPDQDPRIEMLQRAGIPVHITDRVAAAPRTDPPTDLPEGYLLATTGGGVDGFPLLRAVLAAIRLRPLGRPAVIVSGPMMGAEQFDTLRDLAEGLDVRLEHFRADMEAVLAGAGAVVSMAGYCTVAEILASGKPSLLVPRAFPREEQLARARRLTAAGRVQMIEPDQLTPERLRIQLDQLLERAPSAARPSTGAAEAAAILRRAREGQAAAQAELRGGSPNLV